MRIIHFGSYWQKENDIVYSMVKDLSNLYECKIINTHLYDDDKELYVVEDFSFDKNHPVRWINEDKLLFFVDEFKPNVVIVNAGGMSLTKKSINILKNMNIKTIGISLSDPDVYSYNGRIYSEFYNFFYTNSKFSLENNYIQNKNIFLMPFAASTKIHRPLDIEKKHDVVVVGGYRGDRVEEIKKLISHFNVGVYGGGWEKGGIKSYGNVNGERHVEAINSGLIYISFSKTVAGYNNVKVGLFEAAACKKCIITTDFPEVYEYFKKDEEIITYNNTEELIRKISYLLNNKDEIELISKKSYERFLMEHTWRSRWKTVISKIE